MLTDTENRELCGYLGICWHIPVLEIDDSISCACDSGRKWDDYWQCVRHCERQNPDFSDPVVVLREMRKREDWPEFINSINRVAEQETDAVVIPIFYILDENHEDLIGHAALDWFRKEKV